MHAASVDLTDPPIALTANGKSEANSGATSENRGNLGEKRSPMSSVILKDANGNPKVVKGKWAHKSKQFELRNGRHKA